MQLPQVNDVYTAAEVIASPNTSLEITARY